KMCSLIQGNVWLQQPRYEAAEADFQCYLNKSRANNSQDKLGSSPLVNDIQQIRQQIQTTMNNNTEEEEDSVSRHGLEERVCFLEKENRELKNAVQELRQLICALNVQLKSGGNEITAEKIDQIVTKTDIKPSEDIVPDDDDDDVDLFGSDEEEDEEKAKEVAERIKAYNAKKATKPAVIAKSSVTLDVKPWDDETDMKKMEECVRTIQMDGLIWGASKLVPLAYGIQALRILCVIEDDKVSVDDLEEQIIEFEDYVQSVDIAAFNKI
ncbi:elongation factor 1-delta-like, partial [Argonauta hians]